MPYSAIALTTSLTLLFTLGLPAQSSDKYLKQLPQPEGTLYFVRPLPLKASGAALTFIPDFTYNYRPAGEQAPVTVNFSLVSREAIRSIDNLQLGVTGGDSFAATPPELLFLEKKGGKWIARFTSTLPAAGFFELLNHPETFTATVSAGDKTVTFTANGKWRKAMTVVGAILMTEAKPR